MRIFKPKEKEDYEKSNINYEDSKEETVTKVHKEKNRTAVIYTRKAISLGTLLLILLVFVVAGILAYLTDSDSKSNVFTVGDVAVELIETNFDSSTTLEDVEAGDVISKNPQIRNTGNNPAYVYLSVTIPKGDYSERGTTVTGQPLFTYTPSSDWTEMTGYGSETSTSITKVYYYNTILPATEGSNVTTALFDSVTVANFPNFDSLESLNQEIYIQALAIQSSLPAVAQGENASVKAYNLMARQATSIGQKVNYSVTVKDGVQVPAGTVGAVTLDDWEIFYDNGEYVCMIYGDYLPNSAISSDAITTGSLETDGEYRVWSSDSAEALREAMYSDLLWQHLITEDLAMAVDEFGERVGAFGGPDIYTFRDSWSLYGSQLDDITYDQESYSDVDLSTTGGYTDVAEEDNVYFPHKSMVSDGNSTNCYGYWLDAPSADVADGMMTATYTGEVKGVAYNSNTRAFRPVIWLPSSLLKQNPDGVSWDIKGVPSYTVSFNANGGTGSMASQLIAMDSSANLRTNTFTREGYLFTGWNTAEDGSGTSYADEASVTNLSNTDGATVTLYAQWREGTLAKYAVQIYGINQDVDENDESLGLTFGPAVGADYNNSYVTHEYEETSSGSGSYYVKIVTHTVAADGSETLNETPEYLTDSSSNRVVRSTAEKEAYDINLHEMSWAEIEAVSDKSVFRDCMLCGDTKSVNLTLNSTIMSGSTQTAYGDGAGVLTNTINSYYKKWNPRQSENTAVGTGVTLDSNEQNNGSNARNAGGYSTSHIRATLIGSDVSNPTEGYAGDVNLTSSNCLYSCIESDLKNVITPKKVKYVTGSGYSSGQYQTNNTPLVDAIWLFSEREMYGTGQYSGQTTEGIGTTGVGYNKFGDTESKYYLASYNTNSTDKRKAYNEGGSSTRWWLRSPRLDYSYISFSVNTYGNVNDVPAYITYGFGVGFCLK
ncbi:MAG: InlB B-repeat-containing protein [Clostridia bacterium]|nr:InlB B-repeat-containing protein [Clostridia bacterium]